MKIYLVHPISGLSADDVFDYYVKTKARLQDLYDVLTPMYGKKFLRCEKEFKAHDYKHPCTTNHAIFNRDKWMVQQSDIIYANFEKAQGISIGSMMELAWASMLGKHVVVTMPENNIHAHAFVFEAASVIYNTHEEAMIYLHNLATKEF